MPCLREMSQINYVCLLGSIKIQLTQKYYKCLSSSYSSQNENTGKGDRGCFQEILQNYDSRKSKCIHQHVDREMDLFILFSVGISKLKPATSRLSTLMEGSLAIPNKYFQLSTQQQLAFCFHRVNHRPDKNIHTQNTHCSQSLFFVPWQM